MSTERIIVDETIADAFLQKFAAKGPLAAGRRSRTDDVVLGSLVNQEAVTRVRSLVDDALAKGRDPCHRRHREWHGDDRDRARRRHAGDASMPKSFGPVAIVLRAKDVDDAVRLTNDSDHALAAAVFGRDVTRALAVAQRIDADACHINSATVHEETQMHSGGKAVIDAFTERRMITIASGPQSYPF